MALITCPECSDSVSDLKEVCPQCGYPLLKTEYTFVEVYLNSKLMTPTEGSARDNSNG